MLAGLANKLDKVLALVWVKDAHESLNKNQAILAPCQINSPLVTDDILRIAQACYGKTQCLCSPGFQSSALRSRDFDLCNRDARAF